MDPAEVIVPRAVKLGENARMHARYFTAKTVEAGRSALVSFVNTSNFGPFEYSVDLMMCHCPCLKWQDTSSPCGHAYCTADGFNVAQGDKTAEWRMQAFGARYRIASYRLVYEQPLIPVQSTPSEIPIVVIKPFELHKAGQRLGRPKRFAPQGRIRRRAGLERWLSSARAGWAGPFAGSARYVQTQSAALLVVQ
jgi:hypothetical protein